MPSPVLAVLFFEMKKPAVVRPNQTNLEDHHRLELIHATQAVWPATLPARALIKDGFHLVLQSTPWGIFRIGFKYKMPLFFFNFCPKHKRMKEGTWPKHY